MSEEVDVNDREFGSARRERIAMHALAGLCADPKVDGTAEDMAGFAVSCADALIERLKRP